MPSIQELNENLQKVNQLLIRINNLYEYAFNRLEVGALWDDFLRWYEECFVEQKWNKRKNFLKF